MVNSFTCVISSVSDIYVSNHIKCPHGLFLFLVRNRTFLLEKKGKKYKKMQNGFVKKEKGKKMSISNKKEGF